jgi:thymidylate synthase
MKQLIELTKRILTLGHDHESRNGMVRTLTHQTFTLDLNDGFPRLTNRYVPFKSVAVELEGFINGITDRKWYQMRGCKFWDQWPEDLGPIYGWQWRRFNQDHYTKNRIKLSYVDGPEDQLHTVLSTLIENPQDRRIRVSSVNPTQEVQMALPACHDYWKVDIVGGQLDLFFHMRSWDVYLGAPANIQSYAILAHLLANHAGVSVGKLSVWADNAHLYHNLISQSEELIQRAEHPLPKIELPIMPFKDWTHQDIKCIGYKHSGKLSGDVSV